MEVSTRRYNLADSFWPVSILGGVIIALGTALILHYEYVWAWLVPLGLVVAVWSLVARDFKNYWIAVFALVLPLEIQKLLVDSEGIRAFVQTYGFPIGELPAPVLHLSDLPFLVLMLHWIYEVTVRKRTIIFPRWNWMALAFLAWACLSLTKAPVFSSGFFELLRIVKFYLLYLYVANNVHSKGTIRTLINFLLIGMIFQGLLCLYQYVTQDIGYVFGSLFGERHIYTGEAAGLIEPLFDITGGGGIRRASGTVGPMNAQAQYFEFLLPVTFILWLTAARFRANFFRLVSLCLGTLGLVVTFSRGGLIGITVGIVAVLLLSTWFQLISSRKFLTVLLVGLGIGIAIAPMGYNFMMTRPEAASVRLHLAKVALEMIQAHPILGVGLNNHLVLKPGYDPWRYVLPMGTHNHFLIVASEVGIPGLIFFVGFFGLTCISALRVARGGDLYLASVAVGIVGALAAMAVHLQIDYLGTNTGMSLLWLYAGLAAALNRHIPRSRETNSHNGPQVLAVV